ncbi:MAG: error-prone DNA polymerase [Porticoccaceae bacterium]|nr:error-prone DNA polymerase [Porticoccaceae bacterium]
MRYAHLHTTTNFTFLAGASHPGEYVRRACELGYEALAITDECSLAGVVKAFVVAEELQFKLIIGSAFRLSNGMHLIAIAPSRIAYAELSGFITLARRRAPKGEYEAHLEDLRFRLRHCLIIIEAKVGEKIAEAVIDELHKSFKSRLWIGINHQLRGGEQFDFERWLALSVEKGIPLVACGEALMHAKERKPLQDIVTAIRHNLPIQEMGTRIEVNGEAYLKSHGQLTLLYPQALLDETCIIADRCHFSMHELRYQYPQELVPATLSPIAHLRNLVAAGKLLRWPGGVPAAAAETLEMELQLIEELGYEYYFLTVHDIVRYAREKNILCQGRGSAANSVVCYCLFVTEIAPDQISVLFERFISRERDEPPDIDVDFEHQRREEVIQYIYEKYGRERAAIAATVITYRRRSAVRDVGKALGLEPSLLDHLAKTIAWWDQPSELENTVAAIGLQVQQVLLQHFLKLCNEILGFPRHLSQHTGGFVISQDRISDLVPLENASMPDRTIIQWDKEDLEAMRLLKVDVLALGMLSALRRALEMIQRYEPAIKSLADIPREDPATYEMLCQADSVGVFQVESRAQMAMLPRLQPRCFYDLVVQIAIVRPGPILGDMVHPYLRRRAGLEEITYPTDEVEAVLKLTFGVPIFQEQVMRMSMVAAGFSGGEADELRRAISNWGKNSKLLMFRDKFINGLLANGYEQEFAERTFEQVKGFGGYGFPESHSASFALLCYASSWIKRHHPAAFYCALLNSQPMGFYSPSQLVQDARQHNIKILPVDINRSCYDNSLETVIDKKGRDLLAVRLGFCQVAALNADKGRMIETRRGAKPYLSIEDLSRRTGLLANNLQILASADVLRSLGGNRHQARWRAAAIQPHSALLENTEDCHQDELLMAAPTTEQEVLSDYQALGLSLRRHPMALLRNEHPFIRCTRQSELLTKRHQGFIQVAGIVVSRQRPGTAHGTLFVTIEDETGSINVIIWSRTQEHFKNVILTAKLILVTGTVEILTENVVQPVIHVIAGRIEDYSYRLAELAAKARNFR